VSKIFSITKGVENLGALRTGGQGSVYKGRRMGPIITAIKLLPTPIHAEDDGDKNFRNFQNEVAKLKMVNEQPNPNVVKILSSGLTDSGSLPYIEMEFIEGPDLEELLKSPHDPVFTVKEVLKVADHLANALAHCHQAGVKHGDIKSNNIKYNIHTGNYVLLDFGLAIMSDEQRRTSMRHAGAIEFMAPEQNTGAMYFQTDIYSYGIVLYELLAGQVPFPLKDNGETSRNAVMIAHMESTPPGVMELRGQHIPATWAAEKRRAEMQAPPWLLSLIAACIEKDPEKRYPDGMALQQGLIRGSLEQAPQTGRVQGIDTIDPLHALSAVQRDDNLPDDQKFIKIRRSLVTILILAAIAILAFGSYGVFKKPEVRIIVKRDTIIKTKVLPPDTVVKIITPAQASRDSDSSASAKSTITKHKKKRKKFLGIF